MSPESLKKFSIHSQKSEFLYFNYSLTIFDIIPLFDKQSLVLYDKMHVMTADHETFTLEEVAQETPKSERKPRWLKLQFVVGPDQQTANDQSQDALPESLNEDSNEVQPGNLGDMSTQRYKSRLRIRRQKGR